MNPNIVNLALAEEQIERARVDLWEAQLVAHPDSVRLTAKEVIDLAYANPEFARHAALSLVEDPIGFFYKCGRQPNGAYRWVGYRYGVDESEYRSGFPPL